MGGGEGESRGGGITTDDRRGDCSRHFVPLADLALETRENVI